MRQDSFGFRSWLIVFFIALVTIPIFLYNELWLVAKLTGIGVTVTLVIVLRIWLFRLKKQHTTSRIELTSNDVFELKGFLPAYQSLTLADQKAFQHRLGLLMASVSIAQVEKATSTWHPKHLAMLAACFAFVRCKETAAVNWTITEGEISLQGLDITGGIEPMVAQIQPITKEEILAKLGT